MVALMDRDPHAPIGCVESLGDDSSGGVIDPDAEVPSGFNGDETDVPQVACVGLNDSTVFDGSDEFSVIFETPDEGSDEKEKESDSGNEMTNGGDEPCHLRSGKAWKAKSNFTADSPYYSAFCDGEVKNLKILVDTIYDISSKTRTFCKTGALMSDAARRLSQSCKLGREDVHESDGEGALEQAERESMIKRQAIGEEMAGILDLFGQVRAAFCYNMLHLFLEVFLLGVF